jgi:hypothetical protein
MLDSLFGSTLCSETDGRFTNSLYENSDDVTVVLYFEGNSTEGTEKSNKASTRILFLARHPPDLDSNPTSNTSYQLW